MVFPYLPIIFWIYQILSRLHPYYFAIIRRPALNFEFPHYELKYDGGTEWAQIPERVALEYLAETYQTVVPVLKDLLSGLEIKVKCGFCRAKRRHIYKSWT